MILWKTTCYYPLFSNSNWFSWLFYSNWDLCVQDLVILRNAFLFRFCWCWRVLGGEKWELFSAKTIEESLNKELGVIEGKLSFQGSRYWKSFTMERKEDKWMLNSNSFGDRKLSPISQRNYLNSETIEWSLREELGSRKQ